MCRETATGERSHHPCVTHAKRKASGYGLVAPGLKGTRLSTAGTSGDGAWPDYLKQPEPGKYFEFLVLALYWASLCFPPS